MNGNFKIIKSFEDSNVLIDGVTETIKHNKTFLWSFVTTFSRFIGASSDFFSSKIYK